MDKMKIFIGSSSETATNGLLLDIESMLEKADAEPVSWVSSFRPGDVVIERIEKMVKDEHIKAAVFIYSEDDRVVHRKSKQSKPRDNVVFEHGLFVGKLGRKKGLFAISSG